MHRSEFIKLMSILPLLTKAKGIESLLQSPGLLNHTERMPVFFTGHIDSHAEKFQPLLKSLQALGASVKPSVILVISAHWLTLGESYVTINKQFNVPDYPSTGSPTTAEYLVSTTAIKPYEWELDHGAWMRLKHIAPNRNIPVLQLSIDMEQPLDYHFRLARQLAPLRDMGVLIIGSGNIVHNLERSALRFWTEKPYQWAVDFDNWVKTKIDERDLGSLFRYSNFGEAAKLAVPTADHYLPLLYVLSLANRGESIEHTYESLYRGMSLRCLRVG
ncbi:4,5-DOPA dioxygenase extradiol [Mucilaginibacter terrae]|uniref:4,5-DOPA dioxygenase extradiol n=2 Tax=Mucilaginibacter terrae TaxID=1955052 RepID=A0ABU3GW51_9SPHI|nr:4,5-DOPA dioxygenase extradiol [Mucilaginibacter terrae]